MHFWLTMNEDAIWNIDHYIMTHSIYDTYVLFKSSDHLKRFQSYLNLVIQFFSCQVIHSRNGTEQQNIRRY